MAKLTDETPEAITEAAQTAVSPTLLTYATLPGVVIMQHGHGADALLLGYTVKPAPMAKGLAYTFNNFDLGAFNKVEPGVLSPPIEQTLKAPTENEQDALAALRKRLAGPWVGGVRG